MASIDDPLLLLRQSIAAGSKIIATTSPDSSDEAPLSTATHLIFTHPTRKAVPIDATTRFTSTEGKAVDLRSIYFAWLNHDVAIPEYNAVATKLNEEMTGNAAVHMFAFVERLVLFTFLEGASEESEFIKPLAGDKDAATGAGAAATGAALKTAPATSGRAGRGTIDPRLAQIYDGERRMGDRNTILRGIKPTVSPNWSLSRLNYLTSANHQRSDTGLLPRTQARRALHDAQARRPPASRRPHRQRGPRAQPKARAPPRPHYPALPLSLSAAAHVQCQSLPRRRPVHAPRHQLVLVDAAHLAHPQGH